jgi:hypothetical protein
MSKTLAMTGCLAIAAAVAWSTHLSAQSQPVRDSLRRTGEVAVESTRAAARGTRNVIGRAADATRNTVDRNQRNEIDINAGAPVEGQNDINAGTQVGGNQIQGNASLNANQNQLRADTQLDNQTIDSADRYESGYRGVDEGALPPAPGGSYAQPSGHVEYNGRAYILRHDSQGREFICVCGRPVYFDNADQGQQSRDAYKMPADSMQQDRWNQDRLQQEPMPSDLDQSNRSNFRSQGSYGPVPAPPEPVRTDAADVSPAGPTLNTEAENAADLNQDANLDTEADADVDASSSNSEAAGEAREDRNENRSN